MKVGDLVRAMIVDGHPMGIVTKIEYSTQFGYIAHVHVADTKLSWPLKANQLEVISGTS